MKLILGLLTTTLLFSVLGLTRVRSIPHSIAAAAAPEQLRLPEEKHLKNIKQLSFGGENAEAYFSADGKQLIFQSTRDGRECDQIYTMYPKLFPCVDDVGGAVVVAQVDVSTAGDR